MSRIVRSTVTITITETWTTVWTNNIRADETSPPQATTIVQEQPKPQEEPDETILPAVTTVVGVDTQPTDGSPKSGTGSQRKRRPSTG
jgi:hypothetical protein